LEKQQQIIRNIELLIEKDSLNGRYFRSFDLDFDKVIFEINEYIKNGLLSKNNHMFYETIERLIVYIKTRIEIEKNRSNEFEKESLYGVNEEEKELLIDQMVTCDYRERELNILLTALTSKDHVDR
jgi:hypothetical protein